MSANADLSRIFKEMAVVLELTGANPFRVNAHTRVARALGDLNVDVADIATLEQLTAIEGIGQATAAKIIEYLETGRVTEHDQLLEQIPRSLLEVLQIPGLGPKTVKLLWEQAGVTDLVTLQMQLDRGEIEKLPRMGAKTVQNIKKALAFAAEASGRTLLGQALPLAEAIVERLAGVEGTKRVEYAGALRRGAETVGSVDIVAATDNPDVLRETLEAAHVEPEMRVQLHVAEPESFEAALVQHTGSETHVAALRERGLQPDATAADEGGIYESLGLPLIPPELREGRGELDLEAAPALITLEDVKAELHAHTVASDGWMTIDELAQCAKQRGFHTVAVTDHSRSSAQANGLSPQRLLQHIEDVREADARIDGIRILAGSEVDIMADGRLDYEDELLHQLDVVVASPHSALRQEPGAATRRLVAAISHPLVHVLGHPTGRLINRREGMHPDIDVLVEAAAEHGTALEINANPYRLDLRDVHVKAAVEAGALISINTDAHGPEHFDYLRYGVLTARRGWLAPAACINAWPAGKLRQWLESKR
ncbi:MAG: DNA polymerase/3'-5' exonuclease PolX [Planctomycetota bacterium]|jgi:DNA polymerase (family 10)